MRKVVSGIVIGVVIVFLVRYCEFKKDEKENLTYSTTLIEKQIQNVGKLVVTEGQFSQIYSHEDSKTYFNMWPVTSTKKALLIAEAEAWVSYDLSLLETKVDPDSKTLTITSIPAPELVLKPNIQYYDIDNGYFNKFNAEDHNEMQRKIEDSLQKTIEASELMSNAQNRLISELQKLYILTQSMGWTLQYNETEISKETDLERIKL